MSKITLTPLANLQNETTAVTAINNNSAAITAAIENTLSRDGTTPNTMSAPLDMNSNHILNLPAPIGATDPIRLEDLNTVNGVTTVNAIPVGGTTGQSLQKTSNADFVVGWGNSVSSVGLALPADFTVTNSPVTGTGTLTGAWVTPPTGTGAVVRATSPTLVTPALGTPASGVATNLTGTAGGLTAGTVTTNANLTGPITSAGNATSVASQTGTGTKFVMDTSPALVTPNIGVATATTVNKVTLTQPATGSTLTVVDGKTLRSNNTLTFAGTDATTITFQATDTYVGKATTDTLTNKTFDTAGTGNSFSINGVAATANTGTGSVVRATSPTLVTPTLGVATATSLAFSPTTGGIIGTATNDSVAAGTVGERKDSAIPFASGTVLTTSVPANITSITLTAGDWEISGIVYSAPTATTNQTYTVGSINTTSATLDATTPGRWAATLYGSSGVVSTVGLSSSNTIPPTRVSITTNTTFFLVTQAGFTVSTLTGWGEIHAIRVR